MQGLVVAIGLVRLHARATDILGVQEAGDGEGVVTDEFRIQTPGILGSQEAVGGVDVLELRPQAAVLAIRPAGHHEADHALDVPAMVAEFDGQPVE